MSIAGSRLSTSPVSPRSWTGSWSGRISSPTGGSVGFFGPITVRPDRQAQGIGNDLVGAVIAQLDSWGTRHAGLFTFPQSAMHLALYYKFGFNARFLTAVMAAPARSAGN